MSRPGSAEAGLSARGKRRGLRARRWKGRCGGRLAGRASSQKRRNR